MANVRETENHMLVEIEKFQLLHRRKEFIPYIFYVTGFIYLLVMHSFEGIAAILFLFGMMYQNRLGLQKKKLKILQADAAGGLESESVLRDLPDDYFLINDVEVTLRNGQKSQIDHLVLGRGGLFVIQSKNYTGRIEGSCNLFAKNWLQIKKRQAAKEERREFPNPVTQVSNFASRLHDYLAQHGIRNGPTIHGAVLFTNTEVELYIEKRGSIPILVREEIYDFVKRMPAIYTDEQLNAVLPLLWGLPQPKTSQIKDSVPYVSTKTILFTSVFALFLFLFLLTQHYINNGDLNTDQAILHIIGHTGSLLLFSANFLAILYAIKIIFTFINRRIKL